MGRCGHVIVPQLCVSGEMIERQLPIMLHDENCTEVRNSQIHVVRHGSSRYAAHETAVLLAGLRTQICMISSVGVISQSPFIWKTRKVRRGRKATIFKLANNQTLTVVPRSTPSDRPGQNHGVLGMGPRFDR